MSDHRWISLTDGARMPSVGLGLWKIDTTAAAELVESAIDLGYRHLDSACDYCNERQVGLGIHRALLRGACNREELWVTSKLWNTYHRPEHVRPALERTLKDLQLDYLDLYLIHFPISLKHVPMEKRYPPGWFFEPSEDIPRMQADSVPIADTWGAMEELVREGLCRSIGLSNFGVSLIRDVLSYASIRPSVLQVESHPYLVQARLLRYCQQEGIAYTAFSPLGAASYVPLGMAKQEDSVSQEAIMLELSRKYKKSAAQITLRWAVQRGTAVIPKTARVERLKENLSVFDFALTEEEMTLISGLDRHRRFNDPGVFCEQVFHCFYPIYD